jgi:hypothetical protein
MRSYVRYFAPRGAAAVAELAHCAARTEDDCLFPIPLIRGEIGAPVPRVFIRRTSTLSAKERHGLIFGPVAQMHQMTPGA